MLFWHEQGRPSTIPRSPRGAPNFHLSDVSPDTMVPEPGPNAKNEGSSPGRRRGVMLESNLDRVRANAEAASTEDLLDRVTVYRGGMEPEALEVIREELRKRGVTAAQEIDHAARHIGAPGDAEGMALHCAYCPRPAVWRGWAWHRLWGVLPLFPRRMALCAEHAGPLAPLGSRCREPSGTPGPADRHGVAIPAAGPTSGEGGSDAITSPPGVSPRPPAG
jgi:hypothetical protein